MLEIFEAILIIWVALGVIKFSIRLSWGILKCLFSLMILPGLLIAMIFAGFTVIAIPLLLVSGIVIALGKLLF